MKRIIWFIYCIHVSLDLIEWGSWTVLILINSWTFRSAILSYYISRAGIKHRLILSIRRPWTMIGIYPSRHWVTMLFFRSRIILWVTQIILDLYLIEFFNQLVFISVNTCYVAWKPTIGIFTADAVPYRVKPGWVVGISMVIASTGESDIVCVVRHPQMLIICHISSFYVNYIFRKIKFWDQWMLILFDLSYLLGVLIHKH